MSPTIAVATLSFRLGAQPATAGIKHCNRLDQVLAAAIAAKADLIVSGDKDLLTLGSFQGIPITTAARAVERITARP